MKGNIILRPKILNRIVMFVNFCHTQSHYNYVTHRAVIVRAIWRSN